MRGRVFPAKNLCGVFFVLFAPCPWGPGVLWDPEGARGELAVPDVRAGRPAQVPAVPQEGRRHETHPQWHQVGARQLCSMDSRGGCCSWASGGEKKTP